MLLVGLGGGYVRETDDEELSQRGIWEIGEEYTER